MRKIPLAAVPGQRISVTLENRRYSLSIKEARGVVVCDIRVDDEELVAGSRVLAGEMLIPYRYLGDGGNFILQTIGDELPDWRNFGASQDLYFLTAEDLEAAQKSPPSPGRISFNAPALLFGFNTPAGMIMGQEPKGMAIDFLKNSSIIRDGTNRNDGGNFSGGAFDIGTFNRASSATYFGVGGILKTAVINEPRIEYDPATGAEKGLLIEEVRTNLFSQSTEFEDGSWSKSGSSVSANTITAPDGTNTADKLVTNTANSAHICTRSLTLPAGSHTVSLFAKAAGINWFRLGLFHSDSLAGSVYFDVSTGDVGVVGSVERYSIFPVGGGWYRCSITVSVIAGTAQMHLAMGVGSGSANLTFQGDGVSGLYLWGAQLEAGSFPTSYIPTTTAAATRAADMVTVPAGIFDHPQFTMFTEVYDVQTGAERHHLSLFADSNNRMRVSSSGASGRVIAYGLFDGVAVSLYPTAEIPFGIRKFAVGVSDGDQAFAVNGSVLATSAIPGAISGSPALNIGRYATTVTTSQHIKRIAYFPRRLSNAELQEITA